jgi:rubrerythrin
MNTPNLLDAIRVVKGNEKIALEFYTETAKSLGEHLGKVLFEQLSEFERFHYEKLSILEKSLEETGEFINYEGKELSLPPIIEIKVDEEPKRNSLVSNISAARNLEKQAEKAYADLAAQLTDPQGRKMFIKLSEEEHNHYRILTDAYWSLNDTGVWKWSRQ